MGYAPSTHDRAGSAHVVPFSHFVAPMHVAGEAVFEAAAAIARFLMRAIRAADARSREKSAFEVLSSLDDRTLRDIGISRPAIRRVAHSSAHNPQIDYRTISE